jgi:hypothetical protein
MYLVGLVGTTRRARLTSYGVESNFFNIFTDVRLIKKWIVGVKPQDSLALP